MANMRRCEKGLHIYDAQRHTLCPHCSSAVFVFDDNETKDKNLTQVLKSTDNDASDQETRKLTPNGHQGRASSEQVTRILSPVKTNANNAVTKKLDLSDKQDTTLSATKNKNIHATQQCSGNIRQANAVTVIQPVVAWLVIIEGVGEGSYVPIFTGPNLIDFSKYEDDVQQYKQELCAELGVKEKAQLQINYDKKSPHYSLQYGGSGSINLNNISIQETAILSAYDRIKIGNTVMMFIPFCGEYFQWPDD
ncbi:hypothetical protein MNBD_GAMMA12-2753 [hydrothermal vent metagenome]|uniref:FHA domain-containing protein n=1 Tax=hydrothermal vent metagenome TaxID=652676 RepID=A0A3B0Z4B1_9ZZZZ